MIRSASISTGQLEAEVCLIRMLGNGAVSGECLSGCKFEVNSDSVRGSPSCVLIQGGPQSRSPFVQDILLNGYNALCESLCLSLQHFNIELGFFQREPCFVEPNFEQLWSLHCTEDNSQVDKATVLC